MEFQEKEEQNEKNKRKLFRKCPKITGVYISTRHIHSISIAYLTVFQARPRYKATSGLVNFIKRIKAPIFFYETI